MGYISISECRICKNLPQKFQDEEDRTNFKKYEKYINELVTIINSGESSDCCAWINTKLLKCPLCGTYYYYNHYEESSHYPHHFSEDDLSIRRYDPARNMYFLDGIAKNASNILPKSLGTLKKAFVENQDAPETKLSDEEANIKNAKKELEELNSRYETIIEDLIEVILRKETEWHIKMYAIESLCKYFLAKNDFKSLKKLLLENNDVVVKAETASYLVGVGTEDAPVLDLIHTTKEERDRFGRTIDFQYIICVFFDVLFSGKHVTLHYDHGYGTSKYFEYDVRLVCLYNLGVLASKIKIETLRKNIPKILNDVLDKNLGYRISWLLKDLLKRKGKVPKLIRSELEKLNEEKRSLIKLQ